MIEELVYVPGDPAPVVQTKPVRIFQCKDDCCLVRVPAKRFWYLKVPGLKKITATNFRELADMLGDPA